ncbi:MAG: hypothetical protein U0573_06810 [Phycisphaerales bacterium]|nr:hypothetical protein [Planctomycetota bacterium]
MLACLCVLQGCTSPFAALSDQLRAQHQAGDFVGAAKLLDQPDTIETFGERNQLLWLLDRGGVAMALNEDATTVDKLELAERAIEVHRELSPTEQAAQWVLNDTVVPYVAAPYEDMYVNVFKMLAQMERGQLDGGATVEARRLAHKSNILRDEYLRESKALKEKAGSAYQAAQQSGEMKRYVTPTGGEFIESPLGTYLTAITFMKTGDREFQRVAGRRLLEAMRAQPKLFPNVDAASFAGLSEKAPDSANALFVALTGCGPYLVADRIGPIAVYSLPVYFELPRMVTRGSAVQSARAEAQDESGTMHEVATLRLVEDIGAVAQENFARELPLIYERTMVRYLVKAGATVGASEVVAQTQQNSNTQWLIRSIGGLIGLAVLGTTEQADLRCWEFLPARAFVGTCVLPSDVRRVRLHYLDGGGQVVGSTAWRDVRFGPGPVSGQLATIVETTAK